MKKLLAVLVLCGCASPSPAEMCIDEHADGSMLSEVHACDGLGHECAQADYEAEVREDCRDEGVEGCEEPFISREAALCITRDAGLTAGEWPEAATLAMNVKHGPIWAIRVLREVDEGRRSGEGDVWFVDAIDGEIVFQGGYGWQDD